MNSDIRSLYGSDAPRAFILDDNPRSRTQLAFRFRKARFRVDSAADPKEFFSKWFPGSADVIVADWQLSDTTNGEQVLRTVRSRDWEVPFVLISGRLDDEGSLRADVLEKLLHDGRAEFVHRGNAGIKQAADIALRLLEQRDPIILRLIVKLREGAERGEKIATTSGAKTLADSLAELLSSPAVTQYHGRPISRAFMEWLTSHEN